MQINESNLHDYLHQHEKQLLFGNDNDMSSEFIKSPKLTSNLEIIEQETILHAHCEAFYPASLHTLR